MVEGGCLKVKVTTVDGLMVSQQASLIAHTQQSGVLNNRFSVDKMSLKCGESLFRFKYIILLLIYILYTYEKTFL